jgi:hypothetical protein
LLCFFGVRQNRTLSVWGLFWFQLHNH